MLAGIRAAQAAGLAPMKVNAVLMPDTLAGAADLLAWCLAEGCELRFIEEMPLDADHAWAREHDGDRGAAARRARGAVHARRGRTRRPGGAGREVAASTADRRTVGIIASVTRSFCDACDRTRLTADGTIRSCLFSDHEVDLRAPLRSGAGDEELAELWRAAMWNKWAGHGIDAAGFEPPQRRMGAIGG